MCFSSRSGYRPFITLPCPRKLTFRYNSMLNFIQVSFCFLLLGRLPKVDLIIFIRGGGEMSVRTSVRPSTKSFFDVNEIRYLGRGRWVMFDGMPYGRIQGQGQGHEPLKVWIPSIFKTYLLRHLQWELAKFDRAGFLIFVLFFVSRDFELRRKCLL